MRKFVAIMAILFFSFSFAQDYRKGDHELLMMPTAYTMPAKMSYFTDYELFFLNYTYAPTNTTHLSVFTMFPMTRDFTESFSIGGKQQFFSKKSAAGAVWGSLTLKSGTFLGGAVFSFGSRKANLHISLGTMRPEGGGWHSLYMLGAKVHTSDRFAFILEYSNFQERLDNNFGGLITFGARFISESIAWDFGGIRPLADIGDEFLFFPWLKASVFWD